MGEYQVGGVDLGYSVPVVAQHLGQWHPITGSNSALLSIPGQVSLGQWRCGPRMLGSGGLSAKWESTSKLE